MLLVQSRLNWNNLLGAVSSQVLKISKVRLQNILGHAASVFEPTSWKCFLLVSKQNSLHFSLRFLGLSLHISENSLFLPSLYLPIRNFYTLTRTPLQIQGEQSWLSQVSLIWTMLQFLITLAALCWTCSMTGQYWTQHSRYRIVRAK